MKAETFKAKISDNKKDKSTDVMLEGDLSLKNAREIRNAIRSIKEESATVTLGIRNVDKIDLTTIQTIRVWRKLLEDKGRTILIRTEFPPEAERLLRNAGFDFSNLN